MLKTQAKIKEFMLAREFPFQHEEHPGVELLNFKLLRDLVSEEAGEFCTAMLRLQADIVCGGDGNSIVGRHYWASVIDAMCDLIGAVHATSNSMGIDLEPYFDEVHRTNMEKLGGPIGENGKLLKPPGWKPPRIREMLENELFGCGKPLDALPLPEDGGTDGLA